jgi:hypothetical protein
MQCGKRVRLVPAALASGLFLASALAYAQKVPNEHEDLAKASESLLDSIEPQQKKKDAGRDASEDAADASALTPDAPEAAGPAISDSGFDAREPADASVVQPAVVPPPPPVRRFGSAARDERIASGKNMEIKAIAESPLAKLGVPLQAVPAVATVAAAGGMLIWPFLIKTLTGLLKGIASGLLKNRAKKTAKVDKAQEPVVFLGASLDPREIGAIILAALVYGLAITYTFTGLKLSWSVLLAQEGLVLSLAFLRSAIRLVFQRVFNLTTQFKFWLGGALLCCGTAYLGNTLGTVGFEVEDAKTKEEAERAMKLKVTLVCVSLGLALVFFALNLSHPAKLWQAARGSTSGAALAEILPISPMAGLKIFNWRKDVFFPLFVAIVTTFALINFYF